MRAGAGQCQCPSRQPPRGACLPVNPSHTEAAVPSQPAILSWLPTSRSVLWPELCVLGPVSPSGRLHGPACTPHPTPRCLPLGAPSLWQLLPEGAQPAAHSLNMPVIHQAAHSLSRQLPPTLSIAGTEPSTWGWGPRGV